MKRTSIVAVLLGVALTAAFVQPGRGDDAVPLVRVAVADPAILSNFSLEFADALGYFRDEGVNVQIVPFKSGTVASEAVISGQADFAWNGIDLAANLRARGKDVKAVGTASSASGLQLVAARDITSVEQLRGKSLGVGGLGSGTDITMEYVLFRHGLLRGTYNVVPVGLSQTFIAAFQNHQIDGGVTSEPWTTYIVKQGLGHVLVDMDSVEGTKAVYGGPYGLTALWGTTAYITAIRSSCKNCSEPSCALTPTSAAYRSISSSRASRRSSSATIPRRRTKASNTSLPAFR